MQNYISGGISLPINIPTSASTTSVAEGPYTYYVGNNRGTLNDTRRGDVTRGKSKGVKFIIKVLQSPVGQFKDDQLQDHSHKVRLGSGGDGLAASGASVLLADDRVQGAYNARIGDITRGKRKGVKYLIKVL